MTNPSLQPASAAPLLSPDIVRRLQAQLPEVSDRALARITSEIPEYASTWQGEMASVIASAITLAMGVFLRLLGQDPDDPTAETPLDVARQGAYDLGRGEAKSGRTADSLLAAYRIGARVSWDSMSTTAVAEGVPAEAIAEFAALVFAYIDQLSASSVAGHTDQLARSGRVRELRREQLAKALLTDTPTSRLLELAEAADWIPPATLTAVMIPSSRARETLGALGPTTLNIPSEVLELRGAEHHNVLLVSDVVKTRDHVRRVLTGSEGVIGPARPWDRVRESLTVAVRARELLGTASGTVLDTADHLHALVVAADPGALVDLRTSMLAPLEGLTPAATERLTETLRAWLLHLGRRSEVAAALHVHPQTVRYRMNQLRELYGDRLDDPHVVEALVIALTPALVADGSPGSSGTARS